MDEAAGGRAAHPCIARRCGHSVDAHVRTPELETVGETVLWCTHCRRHEVRSPGRLWRYRRRRLEVARALPLQVL